MSCCNRIHLHHCFLQALLRLQRRHRCMLLLWILRFLFRIAQLRCLLLLSIRLCLTRRGYREIWLHLQLHHLHTVFMTRRGFHEIWLHLQLHLHTVCSTSMLNQMNQMSSRFLPRASVGRLGCRFMSSRHTLVKIRAHLPRVQSRLVLPRLTAQTQQSDMPRAQDHLAFCATLLAVVSLQPHLSKTSTQKS